MKPITIWTIVVVILEIITCIVVYCLGGDVERFIGAAINFIMGALFGYYVSKKE